MWLIRVKLAARIPVRGEEGDAHDEKNVVGSRGLKDVIDKAPAVLRASARVAPKDTGRRSCTRTGDQRVQRRFCSLPVGFLLQSAVPTLAADDLTDKTC